MPSIANRILSALFTLSILSSPVAAQNEVTLVDRVDYWVGETGERVVTLENGIKILCEEGTLMGDLCFSLVSGDALTALSRVQHPKTQASKLGAYAPLAISVYDEKPSNELGDTWSLRACVSHKRVTSKDSYRLVLVRGWLEQEAECEVTGSLGRACDLLEKGDCAVFGGDVPHKFDPLFEEAFRLRRVAVTQSD